MKVYLCIFEIANNFCSMCKCTKKNCGICNISHFFAIFNYSVFLSYSDFKHCVRVHHTTPEYQSLGYKLFCRFIDILERNWKNKGTGESGDDSDRFHG